MCIIGLTGGIASGKTTVANFLKKLGAVVLDADKVAKEVVNKGEPAYFEVIKVFGSDILAEDEEINRKKLGQIVFSDPKKRKLLEDIIHPRVIEYFRKKIAILKKNEPEKIIVLDVPLLLETGMEKMVDEVWVVAVSEESQIKRLKKRNNIGRKEALKRIHSQMPLKEKLKKADVVIENENSIENTYEQVLKNWKRINAINVKK